MEFILLVLFIIMFLTIGKIINVFRHNIDFLNQDVKEQEKRVMSFAWKRLNKELTFLRWRIKLNPFSFAKDGSKIDWITTMKFLDYRCNIVNGKLCACFFEENGIIDLPLIDENELPKRVNTKAVILKIKFIYLCKKTKLPKTQFSNLNIY